MTTPHRFPTGVQYQEAVQHPEQCFSDPDLRSASFERMTMGLPKAISGNFASVFPMTTSGGHRYAVKCFTRQVAHQLQRYMLIGEHLSKLKPRWATDFQFLSDGILVDSERYPILRMDWVSGLTLTRWISNNINQPAALSGLTQRFDELIADLVAAGMAHGDLQDGNLLVADNGRLHLVDYDGMYVPGLDGLPPGEVGHPDYQPPGRSQADYGPAMDRFSAWLISLSLKMLVADPVLWDQLNPGHDEYLLLNRSDLADLTSSRRIAMLVSHRDAEVRRLAHIARDILPLPMTSIPALAIPALPGASTQAAAPTAATSGIPGWMRGHIPEPAGAPGPSIAPAPPGQAQPQHNTPARSLTWLVRMLAALPLAAAAGANWGLPAGLAGIIAASVIVTVTVWALYRRDPLTRTFTELRRARARATAGVNRAAADLARVEKNGAAVERTARRLTSQHAKKRTSVQVAFDRRRRQVAHQEESIDRQLALLRSRRQQEISRRLTRLQQEHVRSWLSQAAINANQLPGVGTQLAANLAAAGIRVASDFSGIKYSRGAGPTSIYFQLASGRLVHVPGIGEVKARRIDQWRQDQVATAVTKQPSAIPVPELQVIDAQFATQERQLRDEHSLVTQQVAGQVAAIKHELDAALAAADKQQRIEQIPIDQRRTELAAQLSHAHSGHLAAKQHRLDSDNRLAAARRPTFRSFVGSALRG
ncbi:MAG TPA: hypothetical protein VLW50_12690 [Streptosporangiaceae bacterium]|nr:hypothetical protein [Streptosporangiaceae bacterium]